MDATWPVAVSDTVVVFVVDFSSGVFISPALTLGLLVSMVSPLSLLLVTVLSLLKRYLGNMVSSKVKIKATINTAHAMETMGISHLQDAPRVM